MAKFDTVQKPKHYNQYPVEAIVIIEWVSSKCKDGFEGYLIGNIYKYLLRFMFKNGTEDLKKADWYLKRLIKYREGKKND